MRIGEGEEQTENSNLKIQQPTKQYNTSTQKKAT
jgi:hypothetical protein